MLISENSPENYSIFSDYDTYEHKNDDSGKSRSDTFMIGQLSFTWITSGQLSDREFCRKWRQTQLINRWDPFVEVTTQFLLVELNLSARKQQIFTKLINGKYENFSICIANPHNLNLKYDCNFGWMIKLLKNIACPYIWVNTRDIFLNFVHRLYEMCTFSLFVSFFL